VRNGGIDLFVRLTPKGGRDEVDGAETLSSGGSRLKARVRAVPEKGAANDALEKLVAGWLEVPTGSVAVTAGATARLKRVSIAGDPMLLADRIAQRLR
jgi:uncharacterized protein YggU (UPF0235/DUF167 family)